MFELAIVKKFLIPKWKQLSVSIISSISCCVIALVVWLILVFFSATEGLEKGWTDKLVHLTAPLRLTPTSAYYESYYYQIDAYSASSDYTLKSIREKESALLTDPYNQKIDPPLPPDFPLPLKGSDGSIIDVVKETYAAVEKAAGSMRINLVPFEIAVANLKLKVCYNNELQERGGQHLLSQASYVVSQEKRDIDAMRFLIMPLTGSDIRNALHTLQYAEFDSIQTQYNASPSSDKKMIQALSSHLSLDTVKPRRNLVAISCIKIPEEKTLSAFMYHSKMAHSKIFLIETGLSASIPDESFEIRLKQEKGHIFFQENQDNLWHNLPSSTQFYMATQPCLPVHSVDWNWTFNDIENTLLNFIGNLQGIPIDWSAPLDEFIIENIHFKQTRSAQNKDFLLTPFLKDKEDDTLPFVEGLGYAVILPKSFKDNGVHWLDRGTLNYFGLAATSVQEQRQEIFVAGFYDPGIIPMGGRLILAPSDLVETIRSQHAVEDSASSTGFNLRFDNINKTDSFQEALNIALEEKGLNRFWSVQSYKQFDFTKDLYQQLKSEKNLFSLISLIIILVATSNIISMLIILVHDKRRDIAVLRALGASPWSIASIFGLCGFILSSVGGMLGTIAAWLTVKNLPALLGGISALQGFEVLNTQFYGDFIPKEMSSDALIFVIASTWIASLIAGALPAIKAARLNIAQLLKTE